MRTAALLGAIALLASCNGGKTSGGSAKASGRIKTISTGAAFAESDYKVPGKVVILDCTADW